MSTPDEHAPQRALRVSAGTPRASDDATLQAYQAAAERYRAQTSATNGAVLAFLDRLVEAAPPGASVLELGSGPGNDAALLEERGLHVTRTDATPAFVEMMRADGHEARLLDIRSDDFGGPYDAVLADAVLLHLSRREFAAALHKARAAVRTGGVLAMTLKEGDGDEWHSRKLGLPRHFTYWREPELRAELTDAGWQPLWLAHVPGQTEPWLHAICRAAA
jgi:SAM-dependent methyltransferase